MLIVFILALFLMPMADQRGIRFRILIVVYFFANIAISGTSVFALKTAGIMWFLFGVLSAAKSDLVAPSTDSNPNNRNLKVAPQAAHASKGNSA
jgi:putative polymerase